MVASNDFFDASSVNSLTLFYQISNLHFTIPIADEHFVFLVLLALHQAELLSPLFFYPQLLLWILRPKIENEIMHTGLYLSFFFNRSMYSFMSWVTKKLFTLCTKCCQTTLWEYLRCWKSLLKLGIGNLRNLSGFLGSTWGWGFKVAVGAVEEQLEEQAFGGLFSGPTSHCICMRASNW